MVIVNPNTGLKERTKSANNVKTKGSKTPFGLMLRFAGDPQRVRSGRLYMAEYGEWNRKGATLSDKTAKKEYGVSRDFIVKGIRAGRLEYRNGSVWGNPYIKILRRQLEQYIAEEIGPDRLTSSKTQTELRKIKQEMANLKKRLKELQTRRTELEKQMKT